MTNGAADAWELLRRAPARAVVGEPGGDDAGAGRLLAAALHVRRRLRPVLGRDGAAVLLLPPSPGSLVFLFALWADGRRAVVVDPADGPGAVETARVLSGARVLLTSRTWMTASGLDPLVRRVSGRVGIVHVEDVRRRAGVREAVRDAVDVRRAGAFGPASPADGALDVPVADAGAGGRFEIVGMSHADLVRSAGAAAAAGLGRGAEVLCPRPLADAAAVAAGPLAALAAGCRAHLLQGVGDHAGIARAVAARAPDSAVLSGDQLAGVGFGWKGAAPGTCALVAAPAPPAAAGAWRSRVGPLVHGLGAPPGAAWCGFVGADRSTVAPGTTVADRGFPERLRVSCPTASGCVVPERPSVREVVGAVSETRAARLGSVLLDPDRIGGPPERPVRLDGVEAAAARAWPGEPARVRVDGGECGRRVIVETCGRPATRDRVVSAVLDAGFPREWIPDCVRRAGRPAGEDVT